MADTGLKKFMSIYLKEEQWKKFNELMKKMRHSEDLSRSQLMAIALERMYDQEILMKQYDGRLDTHYEGKNNHGK